MQKKELSPSCSLSLRIFTVLLYIALSVRIRQLCYTWRQDTIMSGVNVLRQLSRTSVPNFSPSAFGASTRVATRQFSNTVSRSQRKNDDQHDKYTTSSESGTHKHEGQHSRTDRTIQIEYPEEEGLPRQKPIVGRGGVHSKRTLASFSMEDRVAVVTGGARGLGLVMSQALVTSGANVAIVDLNSQSPRSWFLIWPAC